MASFLSNLNNLPIDIVHRGKKYFLDGLVHIVSWEDGIAVAQVRGKERYNVRLTFSNDNTLQKSSCSCPCGYCCKHIVAVIYALDYMEKKNFNPMASDGENEYLKKLELRIKEIGANTFSTSQDYIVLFDKLNDENANLSPNDKKRLLQVFFSSFVCFPDMSFSAKKEDHKDFSDKLSTFVASTFSSPSDMYQFFFVLFEKDSLATSTKAFILNVLGGNPKTYDPVDKAFLAVKNNQYMPSFIDVFLEVYYRGEGYTFVREYLKECLDNRVSLDDEFFIDQIKQATKNQDLETIIILLNHTKTFPSLSQETINLILSNKENHFVQEYLMSMLKTFKSLHEYLSWRKFYANEEISKMGGDIGLNLSSSPIKDAVYLYEQTSHVFASNPPISISKISIEDLILADGHYDPKLKPEVLNAMNKKISTALNNVKPRNDVIDGVAYLIQENYPGVHDYLKNHNLLFKCGGSSKAILTYLRLLSNDQDALDSLEWGVYQK
jgi:hypothetical protein